MTNTKAKKLTTAADCMTVLRGSMEAIQHDMLQDAMQNAAEYFSNLEMPYLGKAQICERTLLEDGIKQDTLFKLDLALSRFVTIVAWYVYRRGLKDAMTKPSLAESLLDFLTEDEAPAMLDIPSPLHIHDIYIPNGDDEDGTYYRLKRPEEYKAENL